MDEIAIYNRALSATEILQHYQSTQPLGASGSGGTASSTTSACLDLSTDLASHLPEIPVDPLVGSPAKTYYALQKETTGQINAKACSAEGEEILIVK